MNTRNDYADFDAKFSAMTERAGQAAEQGFSALTKTLQEAIALQTGEIERLRGIIEDGTQIPERHPVQVNISSTAEGSRTRRDVVAMAQDHSLWALLDIPSHPSGMKHHHGWFRLPALPQAGDELNNRPEAEAE